MRQKVNLSHLTRFMEPIIVTSIFIKLVPLSGASLLINLISLSTTLLHLMQGFFVYSYTNTWKLFKLRTLFEEIKILDVIFNPVLSMFPSHARIISSMQFS